MEILEIIDKKTIESLKNKKVLYLVKMGMNFDPEKDEEMRGSDVENYRVRGTFRDSNGDVIFIEFTNFYEFDKKKPNKILNHIKLGVNSQFNLTKDRDENKSAIKIDYEALKAFNYTQKDILLYIKKYFNVVFNKIFLIDRSVIDYDYLKIASDDFVPDFEKMNQLLIIKKMEL